MRPLLSWLKKTLVSGVKKFITQITRNSGERITSAENDATISKRRLNLMGANHFFKNAFITTAFRKAKLAFCDTPFCRNFVFFFEILFARHIAQSVILTKTHVLPELAFLLFNEHNRQKTAQYPTYAHNFSQLYHMCKRYAIYILRF